MYSLKLAFTVWTAGAVAACAGSPSVPAVAAFSFEDDAVGVVPRGFAVAETNAAGKTATWRVSDRIDPDDPGHVVRVDTGNAGSTYNLLLSEAVYAANFTMSVYGMARTGDEDQGGGLVWRARDADNYYIARWNPLEDNVRLYTVVAGERTMLASANIVALEHLWHRLEVSMRGEHITVGLDGKNLIEHRDATFAAPGRIGLWTKADASTLFDRLEWSRQ